MNILRAWDVNYIFEIKWAGSKKNKTTTILLRKSQKTWFVQGGRAATKRIFLLYLKPKQKSKNIFNSEEKLLKKGKLKEKRRMKSSEKRGN